ncbi:MAG TPA: precorrin-6A reductase [Bacillota bacterium]|nr:precorrin-6A reductase [Bacillota bacterium]
MILVLYGTREARELISELDSRGIKVIAAVQTEYGSLLAGQGGKVEVHTLQPEDSDLETLILNKNISLVIDATHPFPGQLSLAAGRVCLKLGIPNIRFEREETRLPENPLIHPVDSWSQAAVKAAELGSTIFLTTGSNNLEVFLREPAVKGKRVVVRVLPEQKVIKKCQDLGLSPKDIVGLQGPFSIKFNRAIFQAYRADVVVSRDSGRESGTDTKIAAALALKIPVVLIRRAPGGDKEAVRNLKQVLEMVQSFLNADPGTGKETLND